MAIWPVTFHADIGASFSAAVGIDFPPTAFYSPPTKATHRHRAEFQRPGKNSEVQGGAGPMVTAAPILVPLWLQICAGLLLTLALLQIARVDQATLRIPDAISLPLIAVGLGLAALSPAPALADRLIGAGAGFLLLAALGEGYFRWYRREGLGLGDAKLFGAAGAWLGWQALPWVLLVAAGAALVWAMVARRQGAVAFGPWLALAFWLIWFWAVLQAAMQAAIDRG